MWSEDQVVEVYGTREKVDGRLSEGREEVVMRLSVERSRVVWRWTRRDGGLTLERVGLTR
jgi:hypothetical protein